MGLAKKLAKKSDPELLALFFECGGWATDAGFIPRGAKEAQIALLLLQASSAGLDLLAKTLREFEEGNISKRGIKKEQ